MIRAMCSLQLGQARFNILDLDRLGRVVQNAGGRSDPNRGFRVAALMVRFPLGRLGEVAMDCAGIVSGS